MPVLTGVQLREGGRGGDEWSAPMVIIYGIVDRKVIARLATVTWQPLLDMVSYLQSSNECSHCTRLYIISVIKGISVFNRYLM